MNASHRLPVRALLLLVCLWSLAAPRSTLAQAAPDVAALDAYFARALAEWDVPGMSVAVVKDGQVVLAKGYGVRERGKPERVDEHTRFAIASNTKAFTAAALAVLVDQKKLSWDDPVRKWLPWFELRDPIASAEIRVRDLVSHRAGLGELSGDLLWYGTPWSREEVLRRARFLEPRFPFRTQYGYSNVMFVAAGEVVAAASGLSWDAFVEAQFFGPLGMSDTVTTVRALSPGSNTATPHGPVGTGERAYPWYSWDAAAAAAGVISSAHDMSRWLLLQLGRGTLDGRTYFSDPQSRAMWTPHISFTISREAEARSPTTHFRGYGMGWSLRDYHGRMIASHGGAYDGMYSALSLVPEERLGVVVLTNGMTGLGDALAARVVDAYLGVPERDWSRELLEREREHVRQRADAVRKAIEPEFPGTKPSLALEAYAGSYSGNVYGEATVSLESGALVLRLAANPDLVADLSPLQFDTFLIRWRKAFPWFAEGRAQFVLDNRGQVARLELNVPNEDFWFQEIDLRKAPR
jgi:CubicO group peptidase (beta-lactamase class C family)